MNKTRLLLFILMTIKWLIRKFSLCVAFFFSLTGWVPGIWKKINNYEIHPIYFFFKKKLIICSIFLFFYSTIQTLKLEYSKSSFYLGNKVEETIMVS